METQRKTLRVSTCNYITISNKTKLRKKSSKITFSGLTGSNKLEAVEKFGAEQVQIWRRSYATPPPVMENNHEYYETIQKVLFKVQI